MKPCSGSSGRFACTTERGAAASSGPSGGRYGRIDSAALQADRRQGVDDEPGRRGGGVADGRGRRPERRERRARAPPPHAAAANAAATTECGEAPCGRSSRGPGERPASHEVEMEVVDRLAAPRRRRSSRSGSRPRRSPPSARSPPRGRTCRPTSGASASVRSAADGMCSRGQDQDVGRRARRDVADRDRRARPRRRGSTGSRRRRSGRRGRSGRGGAAGRVGHRGLTRASASRS